jgi:hypothetical protein
MCRARLALPLNYDRIPKAPPAQFAAVNQGGRPKATALRLPPPQGAKQSGRNALSAPPAGNKR